MSGSGANTYRVGDFVYFDDPSSPDAPYQIRRIDELNRTANGVEARVVLYMRRRDIPPNLLKIADQAQRRFDNYYEVDKKKPENFNSRGFIVANGEEVKKEEPEEKEEPQKTENKSEDFKTVDWGNGGLPLGAEELTDEQRLKLRQREVFLSRQSEIMLAQQIRGKCRVTLLSEVEECITYLNSDDTFFYSLVYDPANQTLLADKGAIRVGDKYQAVMEDEEEGASKIEKTESGEEKMEEGDDDEQDTGALKIDEEEDVSKQKTRDPQDDPDRDVQVYHPYHGLSEKDIDQFLIVARAVGTFARAIDSSSSSKIPTLHMAAACASRDVTILHAMALLHHADYDVGKAVKYLVPTANRQHYPLEIDKTIGNQTQTLGGPLLCRDQMEEWSTPEANLFDEALEKCGKDFNDIKADYLPWKSIRDIVEYYYQYKASNRYSERKKTKQAEADTKLKQVYIPSYNKPSPSLIGTFKMTQTTTKSPFACENCKLDESQNWYTWGGQENTRLCQTCWNKWKKNGGLDTKHPLERFDKNRPAPPPPTLTSNGNDNKPPVLPPQKPINPSASSNLAKTGPQQKIQQFLQQKAISTQELLQNAKQALEKGQITRQQYVMFQNLGKAATPAVAKPASKPNFVYYTTICRRVVRRVIPKSALNPRRLARKPFYNINNEAVLKSVAIVDKSAFMKTALNISGDKKEKINETEFHKGITHVQHTLTAAAAAGKRAGSNTPLSGEPIAKMAKPITTSSSTSTTSCSSIPPFSMPATTSSLKSLETVGNTLLAVNKAVSGGVPYVHREVAARREKPQVKPDSKYLEVKQHGLRFFAGKKTKAERRRILHPAQLRRVVRKPAMYHPTLDPLLNTLIPYLEFK